MHMQYPYLNSGESTIFAGLRRADHEVEGQGELGLLPLCSLPLPLSPTNIGSSTPPFAIYTKSIRQMQADTKHIQTYTLPPRSCIVTLFKLRMCTTFEL